MRKERKFADMDIYLDIEKLGLFAANTMRSFSGDKQSRAAAEIRELDRAWKRINSSAKQIAASCAASGKTPAAAEWILDNRYVAEKEYYSCRKLIKRTKKLPSGSGKTAVVWSLAQSYLRVSDCRVQPQRLEAFLKGAQKARELSEKELSLFLPCISAALICSLADAAAYTVEQCSAKNDEKKKNLGARTEEVMKNIFTSLRFVASFDCAPLLESVSVTESVLRKDAGGQYLQMEEKSRAWYRRQVLREAKKAGITESEYAKRAYEKTKDSEHIGFALFGRKNVPTRAAAYIAGISFATAAFAAAVSVAVETVAALLLAVPFWSGIKIIADSLILRFAAPDHICRMELKDGIPLGARTLCTITLLLTSEQSAIETVGKMEQYMLANRDSGKQLQFALLADLPQAKAENVPEDKKLISAARDEIEKLNKKYSGGFYLLVRGRKLNKKDGIYMGWERKRGAITELARLLRGKSSSISVEGANVLSLKGIKYIIALDGDTRLCAGAAKELVGAMLHPLNRPVIKDGMVVRGHGIMQPRMSVSLDSANATGFSRLFAGQGGADPYDATVGEVYQDLFGRGSFAGKGILDVDAYLECMEGRFPENRVLSHDLLEGECLNAAYISDVELLDSFPATSGGYYSRMHRWTRGDWQSAPWLFKYVKRENGKKQRNQFDSISRFKIFDNLMESLAPVFTFVFILAAAFTDSAVVKTMAIAASLSVAAGFVLQTLRMFWGRKGKMQHYYSGVVTGFSGELTRILMRFILLGQHACVKLSAVFTALYRMLITKRGLLDWVTAAEADKKAKNTLWGIYKSMLIPSAAGFLMLLFSKVPLTAALGFFWLISPLCAYDLGKSTKLKIQELKQSDKVYLYDCARDIWAYFRDMLTANENYLPPDNWQEQPAVGIAHRTSPTNIGLALLAAVSAYEMKVCTEQEATGVIENIVCTVERIPKWHGHLRNWYDTRTLQPLQPEYVSTVDSGNLAGALLTVKKALESYGEKYSALVGRIEKLYRDMDFVPLYDKEKKLFYIGIQLADEKPTEGWYDLMASEARLAGYIAIAAGVADRKHWRKLGRMLAENEGYRGIVSWTGTMFEYLMPNLVMPCQPESLLWESLEFCVNVQKKAAGKGKPWGSSESAFYAFDRAGNYRYKAHGVQKLALKRGMDKDCVTAPYASFLALEVAPAAAVKNLRLFEKFEMKGKYGFYDALDMTRSRLGDNEYQPVKTYMVHHLGMSIAAICNVLCQGALQNYFMANEEMAAFSELLEEKVPIGAAVLGETINEAPEKPAPLIADDGFHSGGTVDLAQPGAWALSNGAYNAAVSSAGAVRSEYCGVMLTNFEARSDSEKGGMKFYAKCDGKILPLLPYLDDGNGTWEYAFSTQECSFSAALDGFEIRNKIAVAEKDNGEIREIKIKNCTESLREVSVFCMFEPVLTPREEFYSHPAFAKLRLTAEINNGCTVVHKRSRKGGEEDVFMAFACSEPSRICLSKSVFPGRKGPAALLEYGMIPESHNSGADVFVTVQSKCILRPGESANVRYCLAIASDKEAAASAAVRMLSGNAFANGISAAAQRAALAERDLTPQFIYELLYGRVRGGKAVPRIEGRGLWQYGISGDIPIVSAQISAMDFLDKVKKEIQKHEILAECGLSYDLVILTDEEAGYRQPLKSAVLEMMADFGCRSERAGVFVLDARDQQCRKTILLNSTKIIDFCSAEIRKEFTDELRKKKIFRKAETVTPLKYKQHDNGEFTFEGKNALPEKMWTCPLATERFGYLAADSGAGHMWHINSRENKITPWTNDPYAVAGGERLEAVIGEERISLFADYDSLPYKVSFRPGCAVWEKELPGGRVKTTAFVPPDVEARVMLIEFQGRAEEVIWSTGILLSDSEKSSPFVDIQENNGVLYASSPISCEFPNTIFSMRSNTGFENLSLMRDARFDASGIKLRINSAERIVLVAGCDAEEKLAALTQPQTAEKELQRTLEYWRDRTGSLKIHTPDAELDAYMNIWSLYQVQASRLMARTSVYQCGGAYGFRDQLQDACALAVAEPEELRRCILLAAQHQFEQGDVQHWWHPNDIPGACERGVRTRCSDDLLWLPYALWRYWDCTGDIAFAEVRQHYIDSPVLGPSEKERYERPQRSSLSESLYLHAVRALDCFAERGTGRHGLPFIGIGDWNDGFSEVGAEGRGESVWLAMFSAGVLRRFACLCSARGDDLRRDSYVKLADRLCDAVEKAWDGQWYLRGYYDNGEPLGSAGADECRIDAIAQSFADFAGIKNPRRIQTALGNAFKQLYEKDKQLIRLFRPAFDCGMQRPGYVRGYIPGVRENGGQYTHGAIWFAAACLRCSLEQQGWEMLRDMLPAKHDMSVYKAEPYVVAADVYTAAGAEGMGGWSWYTGSAGWYCTVVREELLGIKVRQGKLFVEPRLPEDWDEVNAVWKSEKAEVYIRIFRRKKDKETAAFSETAVLDLAQITGKHVIEVEIGQKSHNKLTNIRK